MASNGRLASEPRVKTSAIGHRQTSRYSFDMGSIERGHRSDELFRHCRSVVDYCVSYDHLLDDARPWAGGRLPTLGECHVVSRDNKPATVAYTVKGPAATPAC